MKIDGLTLVGLTMVFGGIDWLFEIIPHEKGSKAYCVEPGCTYLGISFFILGIIIVSYKVYQWKQNEE